MYLIVVGAGKIGTPLIDIATSEGHEVVAIEIDRDRANHAADEFDCLVLTADATIRETLVEAGAGEADALIATTNHDATNVMVCLLAKELEIPYLVSVVHRAEDMGVFRQIGVHTVENPQRLIAEYLFRSVSHPNVRESMPVGTSAEMLEVEVAVGSVLAGRTLEEVAAHNGFPADVLVVAIDRGGTGELVIPRGTTRIEAGDTLVVLADVAESGDVIAAFAESRG